MPNNLSPDISSFETMIHSLIEAIGTALIHFVWQGALVAGCLALVLYLARQAQPQIRYALCVAAMLLMFALPVTTTLQFYYVQQGSVQHDAEIQDVAAAKPVDTIAAGESAFKGTQAAPPEAVRVEQAKGHCEPPPDEMDVLVLLVHVHQAVDLGGIKGGKKP